MCQDFIDHFQFAISDI